jgi:hypothetical protein
MASGSRNEEGEEVREETVEVMEGAESGMGKVYRTRYFCCTETASDGMFDAMRPARQDIRSSEISYTNW